MEAMPYYTLIVREWLQGIFPAKVDWSEWPTSIFGLLKVVT